jgi:hypothetical protein
MVFRVRSPKSIKGAVGIFAGYVLRAQATRKTSGEADFGRSFRVVAGPETVHCASPRVLASQGVSEASRPPEDAVSFTVVPVMVTISHPNEARCRKKAETKIRA